MNFVTKEPINKGWSSDKKYCVTDENGTRYLLRVSDIAQHDTKQSEFNMMKQVASFGVPMCQPIEFGTCEDGVYSIQSWIDGEDAEQVMSGYSDFLFFMISVRKIESGDVHTCFNQFSHHLFVIRVWSHSADNFRFFHKVCLPILCAYV